MLLIGDGEVKPWPEHTEDEQAEVIAQFEAFAAACGDRDGVEILAGEALAGPGHGDHRAHARRARTLTDGPYAEVIEAMGGFYLARGSRPRRASELLRLLPALRPRRSPRPCDPY